MPNVAISSPAASRQRWPVTLVICAKVPSSANAYPLTLGHALQFASEIRHSCPNVRTLDGHQGVYRRGSTGH